MSPELDTLDQLLGGPMSVSTIRSLYDNQEHFFRATIAMLHKVFIEVLLIFRFGRSPSEWRGGGHPSYK